MYTFFLGCSEGTNELIDKPWLFVAENVKQDLFLSFQHMKREMEETDMAEVKPSVVARFGKVLFYGSVFFISLLLCFILNSSFHSCYTFSYLNLSSTPCNHNKNYYIRSSQRLLLH